MCVIIQRDPGFVIPREKFNAACITNPHGWGLSVADGKGVLSTYKGLDVNADELYSLMHDDFKDDRLMLHLRYTTAGTTSLRNAHPFPVLEWETDGVDLRMAHNGTIGKYRPLASGPNSWESDTRCFVRTFVRPLFKRLVKGFTGPDILKDEFIQGILKEQIPATSVLAFIDGFGNTLEINPLGNGGKYDEGWWYSNEYSFNEKHREPKSTVHYRGSDFRNKYDRNLSDMDEDYTQWWMQDWNKSSDSKTVTLTPPPTNDTTTNRIGKDTKQVKFTEKFDITDPRDLFLLDDETLTALQKEAPDDLMLLVRELLFVAYEQDQTISKLEEKLKRAGQRIESLKKGETYAKAA